MQRFAIGDLFVEIEVPDSFAGTYAESGALRLRDGDDVVEASVITGTPRDPEDRELAVAMVRAKARELGVTCVEVAPGHAFFREDTHWQVGFGNRIVLLTAISQRIELVDAIARSVHETHEPLAPVKGPPILRELVPSQRRWLEHVRARLGASASDVETYWARAIAAGMAVIDDVAVALGDELARGPVPFEWIVVTDAFGTAIAVVALRETRQVVVDPFSFVAKRWETKAVPFYVDAVAAIRSTVEQLA